MLNTLKAVHDPKSRQFQVRLSHGGDGHTRIRNLLVVAPRNRSTETLDILAQGINVRRLKTEEIGQSNDAMVVNNACCSGLAESKVDKHLMHLLFHIFDDLGQKLREEAKILQK